MDKTFIEKMKNTLLESRKQLLDQLMASNAEFRQILEDMESKDVIDVAADAMDRKLLETMGTQDLNRLKLMDNALARIEQGRYGLCMRCAKLIPQVRLEAIPYAVLCIDCKSAEEKNS